MKTFDWKEEYNGYFDENITAYATYVSLLGTKTGTGKRDNPIMKTIYTENGDFILSSGVFDIEVNLGYNSHPTLTGQGIDNTILKYNASFDEFAKSFRCIGLTAEPKNVTAVNYSHFKRCKVFNWTENTRQAHFINSILINVRWEAVNSVAQIINCTICNRDISTNKLLNSGLYSLSYIVVNQNFINTYNSYYVAFDNCKFQIGNETSPSVLVGNNADELRQNFADRCTAQNITVPVSSEYGEINVPMGRWVFSNTSVTGEYNTIENSEIDRFAKKRGFYFGHTDKTVKVIPIVSTDNVPQSFAPNNPKSKTVVSNNSISLDKTTSIIDRNLGYADSKIIWLGGKYELTALNVINNLPANVGVAVDSLFNFGDPVASGAIGNEVNYIVRSSDKQPATIKYNGVEYSTSLVERNNVFRGINNIKTFEVVSGKPQILPVLDFVNHNTVQMRIVTDLPTDKITAGNLQTGYWYFVAPNDLGDTSGSVTYKGVKRMCFDSFLATDTTAVSAPDKCHLRRCWRQDYNEANEVTDKSFWNNRQKPKLLDVLPSDLRCFHKNNSPSEPEMQSDANGDYIASGHIDFYNGVNGAAGFKIPAFGIVGSFLQIRIPISTLNPM